jgi:hypothetical protein
MEMFPGGWFQFLGARYTFRVYSQEISIICDLVIILGTISSFLGGRRFLGARYTFRIYDQDTSIICGLVIILGMVLSFSGGRRFLGSTRTVRRVLC